MGQPRATEAVIRNAIRAAQDRGIPIGAVEIAKDGSVRIVAQQVEADLPSPECPPKWRAAG